MELDLNEVASFVRVVEAGGFSAAAKELGVPKSTVSRHVSRLEDRLGLRLLHRTTRRIRLTAEGQSYYDRVVGAVAALQEASAEAYDGHATPRGELRVTAPNDFGNSYLGDLVLSFVAKYPEVRVYVEVSNRVVDIVREGFDCALRAGVLEDSTLVARRLAEVEMFLFASPEYLSARGLPESPEALSEQECVLFAPESGREARWRLIGPSGTVDCDVHGRLATNDFGFVRRLAIEGAGIALMPAFLGMREVRDGRLVRVLPEWSMRTGALHFVYPSAQHMPAKVKAFRDHLLAELDTSEWTCDRARCVDGQ